MLLLAQPLLEAVVEPAEVLQLHVLSEHDRPGDQAEHAEQDGDHLADGIAADEELQRIGGRKDGSRQDRQRHEAE